MKEYHKIQTIFKRNPETRFKTLLLGEYSLPEFEFLKNNQWVFTEKVDGTNIRVIWDGNQITFRGKTDRAELQTSLLEKLVEMFPGGIMQEVLPNPTKDGIDICLYGEGYGPKIQKGGKYRNDQSFVLFDIKIGDWWLKREDVEDIGKRLGIDIVPIIGESSLDTMVNWVETGFESAWGNFIAEGIVARPKIELKSRNGQRIITKLKYKDFQR